MVTPIQFQVREEMTLKTRLGLYPVGGGNGDTEQHDELIGKICSEDSLISQSWPGPADLAVRADVVYSRHGSGTSMARRPLKRLN
ncbi:unnamed protein product [Lota lota]